MYTKAVCLSVKHLSDDQSSLRVDLFGLVILRLLGHGKFSRSLRLVVVVVV